MMGKIVLDGNKMTTIEETHLYLKEQLCLPEYYGKNLDALWDLLSTESNHKDIVLINYKMLVENLESYANMMVEVFLEAADSNDCIDFVIED